MEEKVMTGKGEETMMGPEPGTWAMVAQLMAELDPGFDWDSWKDEMKDLELLAEEDGHADVFGNGG
jgi:hypothetical protein